MSDYAKYVGEEDQSLRSGSGKSYNSKYVYGAVLNATMGAFFFGYVMSAFNPISEYIRHGAFPEEVPETLHNLMTSFVPLGAGVGALSAGKIASSIGRKKLMIVLDLICIIGTVLTLVPSPYSLVFGRLIQGYCVGANSSLVPLYINEVSPKEIGGTLGTGNQLLITIGVLIPPVLAVIGNPKSDYYRVILAGAGVSPIIRLLGTLLAFNHETPKYLVSIGKDEEARQVLTKLYTDGRAEEELQGLKRQKDLEAESGKLTMKDIFSPKYKLRLVIGIMVAVFQQLSGINAIILFSNKIFGEENGNLYTMIMDILQILGTIVAGMIIERLGRKSLLVNGMASIAIILGLFGVISFINNESGVLKYLIWGYILAFGLSIGPIPWVYIADILPDIAIGIAVLGNWASTFLISLLFPIISKPTALGMGGGIMVFAVCSVLGAIYFMIYVKETKGKTEAEISAMFSKETQLTTSFE